MRHRVELSPTWLAALARAPFSRVPRRAVNAVVGKRRRVVRVRGGVARGARMELDLRIEKAYWLGHYELVVQEILVEAVGQGSIVYDVGAHVGFFSVCAGRLGAHVVAFEPAKRNAARVRRNAALNDLPIDVVEAAAGDTEGTVALVEGGSASEWRTTPGGDVPAVSLDAYAATRARPTFLKIDVEGAEGAVLRGAETILRRDRPTIVCELHGPEVSREVLVCLEGYTVEEAGSETRILARPARRVG